MKTALPGLAAILFLSTALPALAEWNEVGHVDVRFRGDREMQDVRLGGPVEQLQFKAEGGDIFCRSVRASFGNRRDREIFRGPLRRGDSRMIEDNLRENGIEAEDLGWDFISDQLETVELNMLRVCQTAGLRLRNEGHDNTGDLIGTGFFATKDSEWSDIANSFDLLRHIVEHEPVSTGRGDIQGWLGTTDVEMFKDVDDRVAAACDVSFGIYDDAALKRFFAGNPRSAA